MDIQCKKDANCDVKNKMWGRRSFGIYLKLSNYQLKIVYHKYKMFYVTLMVTTTQNL